MRDGQGSAWPVGQDEVESLNGDLVSFDFEGIEIEELERRFELAVMTPPQPDLDCMCPNLKRCGTYCVPPPV
jgi:hypothetical protein